MARGANPSWAQGVARSPGASAQPTSWPAYAWAPGLGPTGDTLYNVGARRGSNDGNLTNIPVGAGWLSSQRLRFVEDDTTYVAVGTLSEINTWTQMTCIVAMPFFQPGDAGAPRILSIQFSGGDDIRIYVTEDTILGAFDDTTPVTLSDGWADNGAVRHVALTNDGARSRLYLDGVEIDDGADTVNFAGFGGVTRIGGHANGGSHVDMELSYALVYPRALPQQELVQSMGDPLGFLRRRRRTVGFVAAAPRGGGPFPHHTRRVMAGGMQQMAGAL